MLVGVMEGESLREYHDMSSGAPIQLIAPPIIWLSAPQERLSSAISRAVSEPDLTAPEGEQDSVLVRMRPVMSRNLLNPVNNIPGMYVTCVPEDGTDILSFREKLGVKIEQPNFIPNFLIAHDAMRSSATRRFFRSFVDMLVKRSFSWLLFEAHNHNPDHEILFENFNPQVEETMQNYKMFLGGGGADKFILTE